MPGLPTRSDIIYANALVDRGMLSKETVRKCLDEQKRLLNEGRKANLAQVCVWQKYLSAAQTRELIDDLKARHGTESKRVSSGVQPAANPAGRRQEKAPAVRPPGDSRGVSEVGATIMDIRPPGDPARATAAKRQDDEPHSSGLRRVLKISDDQEQFTFGPYNILSEIAQGGMGVVYRAQEEGSDQVVALKALIHVDAASEEILRRFIQEAGALMQLDHPGLVTIHDIGVNDDVPYYTMDFLTGVPFTDHLENRRMERGQLIEILRKVCEAVHYAHTQGVIHRDLKPDNVMVTEDGQPVLTDFGLAKNLKSKHQLTADGARMGTPLYFSPEQCSGDAKNVDSRTDVYSLGVMLYEILAGQRPFDAKSIFEIFKQVLKEEPKPPRQLDASISPEFERICLKAMMKNRKARYESAQELADEIARALASA